LEQAALVVLEPQPQEVPTDQIQFSAASLQLVVVQAVRDLVVQAVEAIEMVFLVDQVAEQVVVLPLAAVAPAGKVQVVAAHLLIHLVEVAEVVRVLRVQPIAVMTEPRVVQELQVPFPVHQ
jgi:hypothetical protein